MFARGLTGRGRVTGGERPRRNDGALDPLNFGSSAAVQTKLFKEVSPSTMVGDIVLQGGCADVDGGTKCGFG